jgi:hypothetical protein
MSMTKPAVSVCALVAAAVVVSGCSALPLDTAPTSPAAPSHAASAKASSKASATSSTPSTDPSAANVPLWPLTDLPAPDGVTNRPALLVKIDNVGAALPQQGVNSADIVVEEPVEGGLTRLVAIYQSHNPGVVGPVRSARPVDAQLTRMFGSSILVFSGASNQEIGPVKADSHAILIADDWGTAPDVFHRDPNRRGDHSLMADTDGAWNFALTHGAQATPPQAGIAFTDTNQLANPATDVSLDFYDTKASWHFGGGKYRRSQNGNPDRTSDNGRLTADTVIITQVTTHTDPRFHDVLGHPTPIIDFVTGGQAWVLRDGKVTPGRWQRDNMDAPLVLTDANGNVIGAKPGRTWIELLPSPKLPDFTKS